MSIDDAGLGNYAEVDYVARERKGLNFGWRCFEGFHAYRGCTPAEPRAPAFEDSHATAATR